LDLAGELSGHGLRAALPAIPVDAMCSFLAACSALGEQPFTQGRMVSRTTGGEALQLLKRFVDRCHPDSLEWNPPRMLEHMSSQGDVAYSPLTYGYSNYARPGFR